jgi:hypothetical protein
MKLINNIVNFFVEAIAYVVVSIVSLLTIALVGFILVSVFGFVMLMLIPVFGVALFTLAIFYICFVKEERGWNSGVCKKTGKPWKLDHYDQNANPIYSDGSGNMLTIRFIKKYKG